MESPVEVEYKSLEPIVRDLIEKAALIRSKAHVPYSKFAVGAALVTDDGKFFSGCNVENASIGLSVCAERTALTKAVSEGAKTCKIIAVVADSKAGSYTTPCGACRQFIKEFDHNSRTVIYCARPDDTTKVFKATADQLLPYCFLSYDLTN